MERLEPDKVAQIILNNISDGVFTVGPDWRITYFNRAAAEITRVPPEEALGRFCWEVFRASICERECALKQTLETGCPVINKAVYIVNAEGKRVPISISTAALKDGNGKVIGGVETFRDLSQVEELRRELCQKYSFMDIIGKSPPMQKLFSLLPDIAASEATVLIEGPTGSGKELVARAIHNLSPRSQKPFVAFNCAALPDTLLEAELFGYKAGAFTGATKDKPGRFALAQGGTIFLDEIGDVSPLMQVKLLRVLQEKEYEPLGAVAPVKADVRVLAATNKDLASLVEQGLFRADLYFRLNVIKVTLPPLAARKEDLPLLVDHFLARLNALRGKAVEGLSEEAWCILWSYHFPGNVRELQNILEHAHILCKGSLITPENLPSYLREQKRDQCKSQLPEEGTLASLEAQAIYEALERHKGNRTKAARELGIDKTTLWRKMKRYGIKVPSTKG